MKRIIITLICFVLLTCSVCATNEAVKVYITDYGEAYHQSGCEHLISKNQVTLEYAVTHGYWACTDCNPPEPNFEYKTVDETVTFSDVLVWGLVFLMLFTPPFLWFRKLHRLRKEYRES